MKKQVVIGLLGPKLDRGTDDKRWGHWRPTVSLCQHETFLVDRFELIYESKFQKLCDVVQSDIESVSPETSFASHGIEIGDPWDFEQVFSALYDFALNYEFDTKENDYLIHITTGTHVAQICLFLLTESRHLPGKLLQTSPPKRKGVGDYRIIDLDLSRYDKLAERFELEQVQSLDFLKSGIATRNDHFNQTIAQIEHVAMHADDPMLITGPTGAGKSQLARRIYELRQFKRQLEGPFVEVNCATIRGDTAMSTLFGHHKGAYTGAVSSRKGLIKEADGGMLFLDEIGELGMDEQTMLLRAIEDKRFLPVGSDKEVASDFQLISGTNRDLVAAAETGAFREDLLARINLWSYELPGLKDRKEDIEPNLEYELEQLRLKSGKQMRFNKEARESYLKFALSSRALWKGNFRDLNASMRRMVTLSPAGRIGLPVVEEEIGRLKKQWPQAADQGIVGTRELARELLGDEAYEQIDLFDQAQLNVVLQVCLSSDSLSDAGRKLYAQSRLKRKVANDADRLKKYLAKFDLDWQRVKVNQ